MMAPDQPGKGHQLWEGGRETLLSLVGWSSLPPDMLTQSQVQGSAWTAGWTSLWLTSLQLCSSLKTGAHRISVYPYIHKVNFQGNTLCNKDSLFQCFPNSRLTVHCITSACLKPGRTNRNGDGEFISHRKTLFSASVYFPQYIYQSNIK